MTKEEFNRAFTLAQSDADLPLPDAILLGCGLPDFEPIVTTIEQVASLIRYQCFGMFDRAWIDQQELQNMRSICRWKFTIVGDQITPVLKATDPTAIAIAEYTP